jgi:hypothetical protein
MLEGHIIRIQFGNNALSYQVLDINIIMVIRDGASRPTLARHK